jgi:lysylphosphatidylglycerol synthetase-like protein (DUF2156 family)
MACEMQETFTKNVWIKHIITYLLLVFFIVAIDKNAYQEAAQRQWITPRIFLISLVVYAMFLIVTKMQAMYAIGILFLIVLYMLVDIELVGKTEKELESTNPEDVEQAKVNRARLFKLQTLLVLVMMLIGAIGFISYFFKQRREHPEFSYAKFLFGTGTCARLDSSQHG